MGKFASVVKQSYRLQGVVKQAACS